MKKAPSFRVMPAQAGIQSHLNKSRFLWPWSPAFAGMTREEGKDFRKDSLNKGEKRE